MVSLVRDAAGWPLISYFLKISAGVVVHATVTGVMPRGETVLSITIGGYFDGLYRHGLWYVCHTLASVISNLHVHVGYMYVLRTVAHAMTNSPIAAN